MQPMRARDVVPGETERPTAARMREVPVEGHGEDLLNVCGQVGNVLLVVKLPDWNLFALVT